MSVPANPLGIDDFFEYWQHIGDVAQEHALVLLADHHLGQALIHLRARYGLFGWKEQAIELLEMVAERLWPDDLAAQRAARAKRYKKRTIHHSLRRQVMERDEYRCLKCGTHKDLTIDHVVAEANGGTDDLENLQTLCQLCNSRKGTK